MRFAVCTAEDWPVLTKLYLAVFPEQQPEDLNLEVADTWWAAMKTDADEILLAGFVSDIGMMMVLVHPTSTELPEIRRAFLTLAEEVFKILRPFGTQGLTVAWPSQLRGLCLALDEYQREAMLTREVQFTESGKVQCQSQAQVLSFMEIIEKGFFRKESLHG